MSSTARDARDPGVLSEVGFARPFAIAALVVVAIALQSTVLAQITILGVIPQLVFVVIVTLAYSGGERVGMVTGFFGGLLQDLLLPESIVGLTALVYTLVGYGVGVIRQYTQAESVWMPVLVVSVASAVAELGYALLSIILGQPWVSVGFTVKVAGLVVLYNTLLTPFAFPVVRKVVGRFGSEKVYRS